MPHVVRRYNNPEEYLDGKTVGTPVSANMKTFEEAARVRDLLREGDPFTHYYNITHTTTCAIKPKGEPT